MMVYEVGSGITAKCDGAYRMYTRESGVHLLHLSVDIFRNPPISTLGIACSLQQAAADPLCSLQGETCFGDQQARV